MTIDMRRSRQLLAMLLAAHGIAVVALCAVPLGGALRAALLAAIAAHLVFLAARDALLALPSSIVRVCLLEDGELLLMRRSGSVTRHRLGRTTTTWPALVVLGVRGLAGWRRAVVLLPDSADPQALRRLRVALRWNT